MKIPSCSQTIRFYFGLFILLTIIVIAGIGVFHTSASNELDENSTVRLKSFSVPQGESFGGVNVGERTSVWLKLQAGKPLDTTFYGRDAAISALQSNLAEPTSQTSADINADGYPDLISGFRNAGAAG